MVACGQGIRRVKPVIEYFEFRRQIDDLYYQFDQVLLDGGTHAYKRCDSELWKLDKANKGWIAVDPVTDDVADRPWSVTPEDQIDSPPEGEWVSKKGVKSYVHE